MRASLARAGAELNPQSRYNHSNRASNRRYAEQRAKDGRDALADSQQATRLKGAVAVVARMANFIVERTAEGGSCTEGDLRRAGFQDEDLKHMKDAVRVAAKRAPGLQGGA